MALRYLVVKMKALPCRMLAGRPAFATAPKPKDDRLAKIVVELENASKYGSAEELSHVVEPMMEKHLKATREKIQKHIWGNRMLALLISIGGFGSLGYLRTHLGKYSNQ